MANLFAKAAGGNWSAAATWSATSSAGVDSAGPPAATDDVIFDTGAIGTVTVDTTTCLAKSVTFQAAANSIVFTAAKILTVSGNVTFFAGMSATGTGQLAVNVASMTLTSSGVTLPGSLISSIATNITLADNLTIAGTLFVQGALSFAGAFDISCSTLNMAFSARSLIWVAGRTLTVTTSLLLGAMNFASSSMLAATLQSGTASSPSYLKYQGTQANSKIIGSIFTDIDASGSVIPLYNYQGGTLTRTTNINNVVLPPVTLNIPSIE